MLQNSTSASFSFDVVEANGGTFHIGTGVVGAPSTLLVRSAASGPPVGFGSQSTTATGTIFTPVSPKADAINLNWNGTGGFAPGFATNVDGNVGISHNGNGFSFLGYMEVRADAAVVGSPQYIALELTNHGSPFDPNSMQPIIDTLNSNSVGATASILPADLQAQYPGFNVLLTVPTPSADEYLGWDFNYPTFFEVGLGDVAAGIVPEPTSLALLALPIAPILVRRPRRR